MHTSRDFTDAVMTNGNGYLLETGCSNLFWVDQGALFFPHVDLPYLKGVFLQALLQSFATAYRTGKSLFG